MKTILFAIHYLELGGAEKSLLALLESLDYSKVQVDLFVYAHRGELMGEIPPQVCLLPEIPEYAQVERPLAEVLRDGYVRIALARLRAKRQNRRYARKNHPKDGSAIYSYVARNVLPYMPAIQPDKEYDWAVSYLFPHDYVLSKVRARKKACWIHTDYSQIDVDIALELPVWERFDKIIAVSERVSRSFLSCFPSLEGKLEICENRVPSGWLRSRAEQLTDKEIAYEMPRVQGRLNLLSVGRFSYPKNFDNIPDICRRILAAGVDVAWYLIGFGDGEAVIRERIAAAGMEDRVRILGKKVNPYPYMAACDIYVQPSRYEGSPMTVQEAKALGKLVVITRFPTASDVIEDGRDGVIVPMDNEGCARGIAGLVRDGEKRERLALQLQEYPDRKPVFAEWYDGE